MGSELILILVIAAAVAFDFTNGFHDTANAMATSIATGALKPRTYCVTRARPTASKPPASANAVWRAT